MKKEKIIIWFFLPLTVLMCVISLFNVYFKNAPHWLSILLSCLSVAVAIALIIIAVILIKATIKEKKGNKVTS